MDLSKRGRDIVAWAIALASSASCAAQSGSAHTPPAGARAAILDAFKTHDIVGLGEGTHTDEQSHAFRPALIRDPRFAAPVSRPVRRYSARSTTIGPARVARRTGM